MVLAFGRAIWPRWSSPVKMSSTSEKLNATHEYNKLTAAVNETYTDSPAEISQGSPAIHPNRSRCQSPSDWLLVGNWICSPCISPVTVIDSARSRIFMFAVCEISTGRLTGSVRDHSIADYDHTKLPLRSAQGSPAHGTAAGCASRWTVPLTAATNRGH